MPGPFTATQLAFLAFVYGGVIAIRAGVSAEILFAVIGGCLALLALYTVLCTPAVVFLADADLVEPRRDQAARGDQRAEVL